MIDIPPAIAERILYSGIECTYPYFSSDEGKGIGNAAIFRNKIYLIKAGEGYLSFYFPIDSNK